MTNMIYKKYVIEISLTINFVRDVNINNNTTYNGMSFNLNVTPGYLNCIKYLDTYSLISDYPTYFDTYEDAFKFLNTNYNYIYSTVDIKTTKISEVYNNIIPPIKVLRKLKLEKIRKVL